MRAATDEDEKAAVGRPAKPLAKLDGLFGPDGGGTSVLEVPQNRETLPGNAEAPEASRVLIVLHRITLDKREEPASEAARTLVPTTRAFRQTAVDHQRRHAESPSDQEEVRPQLELDQKHEIRTTPVVGPRDAGREVHRCVVHSPTGETLAGDVEPGIGRDGDRDVVTLEAIDERLDERHAGLNLPDGDSVDPDRWRVAPANRHEAELLQEPSTVLRTSESTRADEVHEQEQRRCDQIEQIDTETLNCRLHSRHERPGARATIPGRSIA